MSTELKQLITKRGQIKGQLTRFGKFVKACTESKLIELQSRLDDIQLILTDFNSIQSQIEILSEDFEAGLTEREAFENSFYDVQALAKNLIFEFQAKLNQGNTIPERLSVGVAQNTFQGNVKLPSVSLPEFRGEYHKWLQFYDTFSVLIDNNPSLSNVEKFYYLRGCLKGEAEHILQALEVSNENYNIAWRLLKERFENKRIIVEKHVQALFEIPILTRESHHLLRKLLDDFNKHIRALKSLGEPTDNWDRLLIYLLKGKLDSGTIREWQEFSISLGEVLPTIADFTNFISNRCQLLETIGTSGNDNKAHSKGSERKRSDEKTFSYVSTDTPVCNFCKNSHFIYHCKNLQSLPVSERINEIKKLKLCLNCLRDNHFSQNCRASGCKTCGKRHNTLLHLEKSEGNTSSNLSRTNEQSVSENLNASNNIVSTHCVNSKSMSHVLLSTAVVFVKDYRGNLQKCRTLLDSGSQSNFISKEFFQILNLRSQRVNLPVVGISQSSTEVSHSTRATIKSLHNAYEVELSFLILPNITQNIPNFTFDAQEFKIPPNISLADSAFNVSNKIDMLLGAGVFWELLCVGQIKIAPGQPILQKSKLGWIVSGPINIPIQYTNTTSCNLSVTTNLEKQLEKFWKLEELPASSTYSREELECERNFLENVRHDESGHFEVRLPLRMDVSTLGDSQAIALKRFKNLEYKLSKNPELRCKYIEFINEYKDLGHMTKLNNDEIQAKDNYYLPHHGVINENSVTTKLRVVFDASCKTSNGVSLNDILMVGPSIQDSLFAILLRFRKHNYVLTADITKMYRQVNVAKDQRNLQRILWRSSPEESLEHYCLNTVTYGTASASFLAIRALHQVAYENEHLYPHSSKIILKDFYVDDLLTGADTMEAAIQIKNDLTIILGGSGFELRKWMSNESLILEKSANDERELLQYYITDDKNTRTLGILWDAESDIFKYNVNGVNTNLKHITKRVILSTISQIFDPLGLIGPVIIRAKVMLQQLWQLKVSWDESLPVDTYTNWLQFIKQISSLNEIKIDRHVLISNPVEIQLHGFCDASLSSFGSCIYLRSKDSAGVVYIKLLCAKSRVAPLKSVSLPRLELCGALLLAQLMHKTLNALNMNVDHIFLWTDSTIVLSWLSAQPCVWQTFVSNRVSQIQQLTEMCDWRHVSSADNPADIISRGIEPTQLIHAELWWKGPQWLSQDIETWPNRLDIEMNNDVPEVRKTKFTLVNIIPDINIFNRYSSLFKLQRVIAYCLRFIKNVSSHRTNKFHGNLTIEELKDALTVLIKLAQDQEFGQEKRDLETSLSVSRNSKLLSLNPFLDENKIIRVGGRIGKSSVSYDRKYPIVLPEKHTLTKLIIRAEHHKQLHAGAQAVLASLRLYYWPLNGRNAVRSVLRKCVTCFRVKPTDIVYKMGDLPADRVTPTRPFKTCGIDYAGPFNVKDGKLKNRKIVKAYVCIFICFSTKAVHMEVVGDLSTDSFLNALKRFVSRRGLCTHIYSDNATNFVGADNKLAQIQALAIKENNIVSDFLLKNSITWKYIPPRSPHFGGLWEAAVKSAKFHMKRIIGNANLTFEELYTVITQIEATLNSRPLVPLSSDPNDLIALSPGHFLIGDYLTSIPQENVLDQPTNRLSRFKYIQQIAQHFWSRWSQEYLAGLQKRHKWKHDKTSNIAPGAMVVLKEDNAAPQHWRLGKITKVFPGQDGVIRVVSVKTQSGEVKRAVRKLCLLPIETS